MRAGTAAARGRRQRGEQQGEEAQRDAGPRPDCTRERRARRGTRSGLVGTLLAQKLLDLGDEIAGGRQLVARLRRGRRRILLALLRLLPLELLDVLRDLRVLRDDLLQVLLELLRRLLEVRQIRLGVSSESTRRTSAIEALGFSMPEM